MRTSVVLPAPFGPSRPKTMPSGTSRSTPARAVVDPNRLTTPATRTAGGAPEVLVASRLSRCCVLTEDLPSVAIVVSAGAVSGGHLIPVICRPACSMRSISGLADRPTQECGESRLLLAACGARAAGYALIPQRHLVLQPEIRFWAR